MAMLGMVTEQLRIRNLNSTQEILKNAASFEHTLFAELMYDLKEAIVVVAGDIPRH